MAASLNGVPGHAAPGLLVPGRPFVVAAAGTVPWLLTASTAPAVTAGTSIAP